MLDGHEQWRAELNCWKALLAPFPWTNARATVMSHSAARHRRLSKRRRAECAEQNPEGQVLAAADLSEPLTMHPQLVSKRQILVHVEYTTSRKLLSSLGNNLQVRSFEILRCLGADLLDNDIKGSSTPELCTFTCCHAPLCFGLAFPNLCFRNPP